MKIKQRTSPLKVDPTRSITARLFFSRGLTKLFSQLRGAIVNLVVKDDILGLKSDLPNIQEYEPTDNKKWKYLSQADAVEEFDKWVKDKIKQTILSPTQANKWQNFIQKGFNKGAARAFDDTSKARKEVAKDNLRGLGFTEGRREQFIRQTLSKPTAINKLKLLQQRALSDVKGMADDLLTKAKRTLTDGLVKGLNPTDIALSLSKVLRISEARAKSIAFTELVRAHADGQLEAMEQLGVEEVGVAVEWSTTATPCKLCQPLEGIILTIEEAKGMIPRHVRCMCAWLPANVGEDKEEKKQQIRGKYRIDQAIKKSRRLSDQKGWKPYIPIARSRPKPTVNVLLDCDCSGMERFTNLLQRVDNSEKLEGGNWVTIHGQHIYIKDGKAIAGGSPELRQDINDGKHGNEHIDSHKEIEIKVPKTAKEGGQAMADALATIKPEVAANPELKAKVASNWTKELKGRIISSGSDYEALKEGVASNNSNKVFSEIVAKHGLQAVILVKGEGSNRAEAVGATTLVHSHSIEPLHHVDKPPTPGMSTGYDNGGVAAVLRHEYAHRIFDSLPEDKKKQWIEKAKEIYPVSADVAKELTRYAGTHVNKEEWFTEAFTIGTSNGYNSKSFSDRAKKLIDLTLETARDK